MALLLRKRADKSDARKKRDGTWPLKHVELVGDPPAEWNPSDNKVAEGLNEGWLEIENPTLARTSAPVEENGKTVTRSYPRDPVMTGDAIVLKLKGKKLRYEIVEHPGIYEEKSGPPRISNEYRTKLRKG